MVPCAGHGATALAAPGDDVPGCKSWLTALAPRLTHGPRPRRFNQGPDHRDTCQPLDRRPTYECAIVLALTTTGLDALGLAPEDRDTFPAPFVNGMTSPPRARALGDHATDPWEWGRADAPVDATVPDVFGRGVNDAAAVTRV